MRYDNYDNATAREVFAGNVRIYADLIYDMGTAAYVGDWEAYNDLIQQAELVYATFDDLIDAIPEVER